MIVRMDRILLVDTCGGVGSVAVGEVTGAGDPGATLLGSRSLPGRATQEQLLDTVSAVLAAASLTLGSIQVLAVVAGPGSFTGTRIGLAAVKGLAEALQLPVVSLSRLAVLASKCTDSSTVEAWIDAGRGDVFTGRYRGGLCLAENMLHGADAVARLPREDSVIVMEELLLQLCDRARLVPQVSARDALPLAVAAYRTGLFADVALLDANYLRVPDAELARLARAGTPA